MMDKQLVRWVTFHVVTITLIVVLAWAVLS